MCGIVGLLIKDPAQRASLGPWVTRMLTCMSERGPDSAGLAAFAPAAADGPRRYSLLSAEPHFDWDLVVQALEQKSLEKPSDDGPLLEASGRHAILEVSTAPAELGAWLHEHFPQIHVLSAGRSIQVYKDEGLPAEIAERYDFEGLSGTHAVGHTRMATESAVSPWHAHPFTAGEDFCLVHNGSLSNPYSLRRMLERRGIHFETDNDTEAACRFLEWRMREGESLREAIAGSFEHLDGFYTLLMATADELLLVRDPFACKPAVVAETDDYVAVASEFRSLAVLPGVAQARLFEPSPQEIYAWRV
jgi:glutamate synthase domain-containing protein 1